MPGSGGIGGGSCHVWFRVGKRGQQRQSDPAVGENDYYDVTFTFPGGTEKTVPMGPRDQITYTWRDVRKMKSKRK
jgi:hypothetical protein